MKERPRDIGNNERDAGAAKYRRGDDMAKTTPRGDNRGKRPAGRRKAAPEAEGLAQPATAGNNGAANVAASVAAATSRPGGPTREDVARRAYELFQARGGKHGYDIEDWLKAERELRGAR
jgi:hypothetical protein